MGKIRKIKYEDKEFEYDEDAPCIVCGEPVIGASMGGTDVCPSCDCDKCRYCGIKFMIFKETMDNGKSKQNLLDHMKWHHNNTPDIVRKVNEAHRYILDKLEEKRKEKEIK